MKSFQYRITDLSGIHLRPAGLLVQEATGFSSMISLCFGDKMADAKRLFSVLGLGVKSEDEVTIEAEGPDEASAIVKMAEFFTNHL